MNKDSKDFILEIVEGKIVSLKKQINDIKNNEWIISLLIEEVEKLDKHSFLLNMIAYESIFSEEELNEIYKHSYLANQYMVRYNLKKDEFYLRYMNESIEALKTIINSKLKSKKAIRETSPKLILEENKFQRISKRIRYGSGLTSEDYKVIVDILKEQNIFEEDKVTILNDLNYYNLKPKQVDTSLKQKISTFISKKNAGLKIVSRNEIKDKSKMKLIYNIVPSVFSIMGTNDYQDIEETVLSYFEEYTLTSEEQMLFLSLLLEETYKEIINYKELMLEKDFYVDQNSVVGIMKEVEILYNMYNKIRNMYMGISSTLEEENVEKRVISYGLSDVAGYARAEKDIDDLIEKGKLPLEQARHAITLLEGFINKSTRVVFETLASSDDVFKIKLPSGKGTSTGRLKKPRFLIRKSQNNGYLIIGFFLKSDQKGSKEYETISNRIVNEKDDPIMNDEITARILTKLESLVNGKKL